MKNKVIVTLLLLIILLVAFFKFIKKTSCQNKQATVYKLENKSFCLLVANSSAEWTKGLMNYKKPVNFDGMIFIFPDKKIRTFWNKNTFLNLDLYWLDGDKVVGKSELPSIEKSDELVTVSSGTEVNRVVEIIK